MNSTRHATFTSSAKDEIELRYIQQYGPAHALTGKPAVVYYQPERYAEKQVAHGLEVYPNPTG